jgi:membrane fusion protein (multidrug efflux system)
MKQLNSTQIPGRADSFRRRSLAVLGASLILALVGCGKSPSAGGPGGPGGPPGAGGPGGGAMPPPEVGVLTVAPETAIITVELPGRVNPVRMAEVRARVTGILLKRSFEEGADVQADQVLFQIDPAPLQATYDSAKASLAKAEASAEQAAAKAKRNEGLIKINGVSQQAYEDAVAGERQSEADVLAAKADLEMASLNLGYTKVTAPISGRIGKAMITEGALASASEATRMAVIQQLDPIYVDFTQSSADMLKLRHSLESGKLQSLSPNSVKITLFLEDGTAYNQTGRLVFSDVSVDASTGSVVLRGEFPNPDKILLPGAFVRGAVQVASQDRAILVPQRALSRDTYGQASVMIVNATNSVESRSLQVSSMSGENWVVTSGLNAGDRVIVEGGMKVGPLMHVTPVPFHPSTGTNAAAGAATH